MMLKKPLALGITFYAIKYWHSQIIGTGGINDLFGKETYPN